MFSTRFLSVMTVLVIIAMCWSFCDKSQVEIKNNLKVEPADSIIVLDQLIACYEKLPEKYIDRFSIASDIDIGDTAWASRLVVDSFNNVWLFKEQDIDREEIAFSDIRITRDSTGYIADLRFCDDKKFRVLDFSQDKFKTVSFPVYRIVTEAKVKMKEE